MNFKGLQYFEQFEFHGALAVSRNALSKSAFGLHSRYLCGTNVQMYMGGKEHACAHDYTGPSWKESGETTQRDRASLCPREIKTKKRDC